MAHKRRRTHKRKNPSGRRAGNYPTGVIEFSRQGVAFVDTEEGSFIIGAKRTGGAMPGDTVEVRPHKSAEAAASQQQRRNASVVRVTHRATEYLVGVLEINDPLTVVVAQDPRVRHDLFVTEGELPAGAKAGDVVLAKITQYPARRVPMQGYVVEVLGQADAPGMDIDIIIHNAGLATEFSPQALEQAAAITPAIEEALAERGRRDLRQRTVFTIDPADAKDFDDALSLERADGLWRLGVHIADVSSYVPFDSSIDLCARDRGTSVYLVDRVLPMLPEQLSNDVCSLRPGQARRTMTCDMFLTDAGQLVRYDIYPSVITSKRRYTYTEVQAILEGQPDEFEPQLQQLHRLAQMRVAARTARGALDFEFPEAKPVLDEAGQVQRVELRTKTDATSLVEEAMILANETVAQHLRTLKRPCVYRVHEAPTAASLATLLPVLKELGYGIEGLGSGEPARFQQLLASASGKMDAPLVNSLVLRSMERAHYSVELSGHFGLASECYCHFTSPIRRYPDLMVHRLLKDPQAMEGQLEWLARHSSKMERVAEEAEDDSVALKLCESMEGQVGQVLEGSISRVQQRALRVRLANTLEGHVRIDPVHDGAWRFDTTRQLLTSDETGRTLRLGQRVRVRVEGVYPNERRVELSLA